VADERAYSERINAVVQRLTALGGVGEAQSAPADDPSGGLEESVARLECYVELLLSQRGEGAPAFPARLPHQPLAWRDEATGLWSSEYARDILPVEFDRAQRYGYPLACLMVAIDGPEGPKGAQAERSRRHLLSALAQAVVLSLRSCDICCLLDDETVLALLPNTSLEGTIMLARRLRDTASGLRVAGDVRRGITVSIGGFTLAERNATSATEVLAKAGEALREAQTRGGDNACMRGGYRWDLAAGQGDVEWPERPSARR
jgi:diguanylate cyclase (GGDEF)-like protein